MGREVRRVPVDWEHPRELCKHSPWAGGCDEAKRSGGYCYKPLMDGADLPQRIKTWKAEYAAWERGERADYAKDETMEFWEWDGGPPMAEDYMPVWPEEKRTHYQMYESTSEGTPISPVMDSPEALARWLVSNGASAFGDSTASYESWLRVARGGYAPSAVSIGGGPLQSGVEGLTK